MISFLICLAILIGGYFTYGKVVDSTFGPDDRETPAVRINDGIDYVVMPQWKLFLVQLLNIAGLGPIFGALSGALWGPVVFLWITFGTIFAGSVHDYFSGMLSERNEGASISEITGIYLGNGMKNVMRVFSVVLLVMVGTVFAVGPAGLLQLLFTNAGMTNILTNKMFWLIIILIYYFIATFISVDKVIGKVYPLFGICLIIMAAGVAVGVFTNSDYVIPEIWSHFTNMHPSQTPIWSFMFITVACGAIIACPITSGDTAFRSARLTLADWLKVEQKSYMGRLKLCIPVLGVGAFLGIGNALGKIDYNVIWRYFSWSNQTLAMIVLWAASMYLFQQKKNYWITAVPATFMSAVSSTYFLLGEECLGQFLNKHELVDGVRKLVGYNTVIAYPVGIIFAAAMLFLFIRATKKQPARI